MSEKNRILNDKVKKRSVQQVKGRKSISVDTILYNTLRNMRDEMSQKLGGKVTFNMVVQSLLYDHCDLKNVKGELAEIKCEMDETQNYLKDMLKLALINSKQQTQFIPIQNSVGVFNPPSPPSPPLSLPNRSKIRPPTNFKPINSGDLKKDYIYEIKQIFNGSFLKPSEVINITQPKHKDSDIEELGINIEVPDIFERSVAKHFKKLEVETMNV
ncbi:MAG: hypothetical protein GY870_00975 [archaeon]|nr:hypothetical protein [archaeon]